MAFNLGDISPLAGIATGKGMIGKLAGKGGLGLLPKMIADNAQEDDEAAKVLVEAEKERVKKAGSAKQMKKGGVTRADGCIAKGHTKGRMV